MSESIDPGGSGRAGILEFLIAVTDQFSDPLEKAAKHVEHLTSTFGKLATAGAEALAGFELFKHAVEPAEEFETAQLKLQQVLGLNNEQLEEAQKQVDLLSTKYAANAEELTAAQATMGQYTGSFEEAMKSTEIVAKLMAATHMDATSATKLLGVALNDMRKPGETAEHAMQIAADKVTVLINKFPSAGSSATRMARDIANLASETKKWHLDTDQVLGMMAELNRSGLAGPRGSFNLLTSVIDAMMKKNSKGIDGIQKFGLALSMADKETVNLVMTLKRSSPEAIEQFAQSIGMGGRSLMQIVDKLHESWEAQMKFVNSSGAAEEASKQAMATAQKQGEAASNAWTDLKVAVGQPPLLATLKDLYGGFTNITSAIREFLEAHEGVKKAFAIGIEATAFLLTLKGILGVFTALRAAASMLGVSLAVNPWVFLVTATVVAGYEIYKNWEEIKKAFGEGKEWLEKWSEDHGWVKNIKDLLADLKWTDILSPEQIVLIKKWTTEVVEAFRFMVDAISKSLGEWKVAIGETVDWIGSKLQSLVSPVSKMFGLDEESLKGKSVFSVIKNTILGRDEERSTGIPGRPLYEDSYSLAGDFYRGLLNFTSGIFQAGPGAGVSGFAPFGAPQGAGGASVTQNITHSPTINIEVKQTNATPDEISSAVKSGVSQSNDSLSDLWRQQAEDRNRTSFGDSRLVPLGGF